MLLGRLFRRPPFAFADLEARGPTSDRDLTLHEPSPLRADAFLLAAAHRDSRTDPTCQVSPARLREGLARWPRGREQLIDAEGQRVWAYRFWMYLDPPGEPLLRGYAGTINLRLGGGEAMARYVGHVGYAVFPPCRGRHLAERSTRLLLPLARHHGLAEISITCDPDNAASRRTIERLGGRLIETVDVPMGHPLRDVGEVRKSVYHVPTTSS